MEFRASGGERRSGHNYTSSSSSSFFSPSFCPSDHASRLKRDFPQRLLCSDLLKVSYLYACVYVCVCVRARVRVCACAVFSHRCRWWALIVYSSECRECTSLKSCHGLYFPFLTDQQNGLSGCVCFRAIHKALMCAV